MSIVLETAGATRGVLVLHDAVKGWNVELKGSLDEQGHHSSVSQSPETTDEAQQQSLGSDSTTSGSAVAEQEQEQMLCSSSDECISANSPSPPLSTATAFTQQRISDAIDL